jgi:hypothetical protein
MVLSAVRVSWLCGQLYGSGKGWVVGDSTKSFVSHVAVVIRYFVLSVESLSFLSAFRVHTARHAISHNVAVVTVLYYYLSSNSSLICIFLTRCMAQYGSLPGKGCGCVLDLEVIRVL